MAKSWLIANNKWATALDLPFYDIFVPQKISLSKISNDVIDRNLWFGSLSIKNLCYVYGYNGNLPPVTVTSDAIGLLYVGLFFGLELVLVMIRVDCAKFKLWIWLTLFLKLNLTLMFNLRRQMWLQPLENIDIDLQLEQNWYYSGSVYCTAPVSDIKSLVHLIAFSALIRFKYSTLIHRIRSPDGVVVSTLGCNAEGWDFDTHRTHFLKIALESYFASKSFFFSKIL